MSTPTNTKISIKTFLLLHAVLLLYALSSICSKAASQFEFLTLEFILLYGTVVFLLLLYAILWQQMLKRMPLFIAYANKSIVVIWGMLFGFFIFKEELSFYSVIGAVLITIGVFMVMKKDE